MEFLGLVIRQIVIVERKHKEVIRIVACADRRRLLDKRDLEA
jgi:hypothetical protein